MSSLRFAFECRYLSSKVEVVCLKLVVSVNESARLIKNLSNITLSLEYLWGDGSRRFHHSATLVYPMVHKVGTLGGGTAKVARVGS